MTRTQGLPPIIVPQSAVDTSKIAFAVTQYAERLFLEARIVPECLPSVVAMVCQTDNYMRESALYGHGGVAEDVYNDDGYVPSVVRCFELAGLSGLERPLVDLNERLRTEVDSVTPEFLAKLDQAQADLKTALDYDGEMSRWLLGVPGLSVVKDSVYESRMKDLVADLNAKGGSDDLPDAAMQTWLDAQIQEIQSADFVYSILFRGMCNALPGHPRVKEIREIKPLKNIDGALVRRHRIDTEAGTFDAIKMNEGIVIAPVGDVDISTPKGRAAFMQSSRVTYPMKFDALMRLAHILPNGLAAAALLVRRYDCCLPASVELLLQSAEIGRRAPLENHFFVRLADGECRLLRLSGGKALLSKATEPGTILAETPMTQIASWVNTMTVSPAT